MYDYDVEPALEHRQVGCRMYTPFGCNNLCAVPVGVLPLRTFRFLINFVLVLKEKECQYNALEAEAGGSPGVQGQLGLHSKFQAIQGYTVRPD